MGFFGTKNKGERKLIFDIGSSQVNVSLVLFNYQSKPDVKRQFKSENIILPETDLRRLWRKVAASLDKIMRAYKEDGVRTDEALVVFSSPWYHSEIYHFLKKFDSPQIITEDHLKMIVEEARARFKKEATPLGLLENDLAIIHSDIIGVKLNGYSLGYPHKNVSGKIAQEISASVYVSAFFSEAALYIKRALQDHGIKTVEFQNSPWIFFDVLTKEGFKDVSVVEVGGEITDIIMIREGNLRKIAGFGRGYNYVARRLGSALGLGLDEAYSLLRAYEENKLDVKIREGANRILDESVKEWFSLLKGTAEKMNLNLKPEEIILTGQAALINFQNTIQSTSLNPMEFYIKYVQYGAK